MLFRSHASNPWDAAKFEVCAHRYVDVSEPGFGVAVLNDGRYGHGVQEGGVTVSLLRAAKYPDPVQDHGHHSVTVSLLPHRDGLAPVIAEAEALNLPLREVSGGSANEVSAPLVRVDGIGVEVDAVKRADDGSGDLIVRLHEALGARTAVTVRTVQGVQAADRCNLLEEVQGGIETSDRCAALTLRPLDRKSTRLNSSH